jgi:signal transduction histidine kinase
LFKKQLLFVYFITSIVFAKNNDSLTTYFHFLKSYQYKEASKSVLNLKDANAEREANLLLEILNNPYGITNRESTNNYQGNTAKLLEALKNGYIELFIKTNYKKSFKYFNEAINYSLKTKNKEALKFCYLSKLLLYNYQVVQTNSEQHELLIQYEKQVVDVEDKFHFLTNVLIYNLRKINLDYKVSDAHLEELKALISKFNDTHIFKPIYYSIMGVYISDTQKEKALYYFNLSNGLIKTKFLRHLKFRNYIQISHIYKWKKEYFQALKFIEKAELYYNIADSLKVNYYLNIYKADIYSRNKKYKQAYSHISNSLNINERLNYYKNNIEISNLKEEFDTEKTEKENLQLKIDTAKSKIFMMASILVLFLVLIIGTLILKNSQRERKALEQQKELEKQKNITYLKEQEITTINAMVDGQEKERKRIAEDLHDNLGSVLATLKLHFENLKINREKKKINQETLFDKTENLIDEAYLKVRSIAHAKNAGVIANQGLLLAVQMMAEKISTADKINIEVVDFGLNQRLENSLEITTFRVIQELITNVIKHANAKNATINISLYDKNLNIIVEDDGVGFDITKINLKNGMGISSIKTRIEYLKGTFDVDSTIDKGSSIIIDIPII